MGHIISFSHSRTWFPVVTSVFFCDNHLYEAWTWLRMPHFNSAQYFLSNKAYWKKWFCEEPLSCVTYELCYLLSCRWRCLPAVDCAERQQRDFSWRVAVDEKQQAYLAYLSDWDTILDVLLFYIKNSQFFCFLFFWLDHKKTYMRELPKHVRPKNQYKMEKCWRLIYTFLSLQQMKDPSLQHSRLHSCFHPSASQDLHTQRLFIHSYKCI